MKGKQRTKGKVIIAVLAAALFAGSLAGCGAKAGSGAAMDISGSSALYPLAQAASTEFIKDNPDIAVHVAAGGSGTGLNNVLSKTVDIGNSDVYADEKLSAGDAAKLTDHKVCVIGVALIVNPDVGAKVKNLTTSQLKGIFNGAVTNWKKVGGPDETITIINRPSSSGTRALFTKWALGGQDSIEGSKSLQTDDSNALLTTVSGTKGAIGYLALSYLTNAGADVSKVKIDGVEATYPNIYSGAYQVWGYEHMYTNGTPTAQVKTFLDFMTSQKMVTKAESMGYGATAKLSRAAAASR